MHLGRRALAPRRTPPYREIARDDIAPGIVQRAYPSGWSSYGAYAPDGTWWIYDFATDRSQAPSVERSVRDFVISLGRGRRADAPGTVGYRKGEVQGPWGPMSYIVKDLGVRDAPPAGHPAPTWSLGLTDRQLLIGQIFEPEPTWFDVWLMDFKTNKIRKIDGARSLDAAVQALIHAALCTLPPPCPGPDAGGPRRGRLARVPSRGPLPSPLPWGSTWDGGAESVHGPSCTAPNAQAFREAVAREEGRIEIIDGYLLGFRPPSSPPAPRRFRRR